MRFWPGGRARPPPLTTESHKRATLGGARFLPESPSFVSTIPKGVAQVVFGGLQDIEIPGSSFGLMAARALWKRASTTVKMMESRWSDSADLEVDSPAIDNGVPLLQGTCSNGAVSLSLGRT